MQASEHSLTAPALNKIFVWLRSVFLTATLKNVFLQCYGLKLKTIRSDTSRLISPTCL